MIQRSEREPRSTAGPVLWWEPLGRAFGEEPAHDRHYRFMLWRATGRADLPPFVFVMLNPGSANPLTDGPTLRKCLHFAERENRGGIVVVNLFPWKTTKPEKLFTACRRGENMRHEENDRAILHAAELGPVICAWGHHAEESPVREQASSVLHLLRRRAHLLRLGITRYGHPMHPYSAPKDAPLTDF